VRTCQIVATACALVQAYQPKDLVCGPLVAVSGILTVK